MSTGDTARPGYRFSESHNEDSTLNHALPTEHIDTMIDGLGENPGNNEMFGALIVMMMSAQRRGWSLAEFENTLTGRYRLRVGGVYRFKFYRLWIQCQELWREPEKELGKIWDKAERDLDNALTVEQLHEAAVQKALAWRDRLNDGADGLDQVSLAVMGYVIDQTEKRRINRVTCPAREIELVTGAPRNTVYRRLKRLTAQGHLVQHGKGWYRNPIDKKTGRWRGGSGKAAIYELGPTPIPYVASGAS